jgi:hypothetical protein
MAASLEGPLGNHRPLFFCFEMVLSVSYIMREGTMCVCDGDGVFLLFCEDKKQCKHLYVGFGTHLLFR